MARALILQPSPLDRLDPVAAAVRWWTTRLAEVFAPEGATTERRTWIGTDELEHSTHKRLPRRLGVELSSGDVFVAKAALPPGSPEAHQKALALRIGELAPVDPSELEIAACRVQSMDASASVYAVSMARTARLGEIEEAARSRGARDVLFRPPSQGGVLRTPTAMRRRRRAAIVDTGLAVGLAAALSIAVVTMTRTLEQETAALADAERAIRAQAVAVERARRDADLSADLIARGVLDRRAGAALDDLAALNAATPDAAFWTRVQWRPGEVLISGASEEAAAAIEQLSQASEDWSVALSGAVRGEDGDASDARQTFDLRLSRREERGDAE
ncbi:MAG: hypothetical protein PVI23_15065 [Maricaulaceae bacterium]|jgi:hypothetical protein